RGLELPLTAEVQTRVKAFGDEFLDPGLRHSQHGADDLDRDSRVNDLTRTAYRWLCRLATDDVDPASTAIWQDWQRIEEQVSALAPVLRHLDRIVDNLRFARWNPLGPLQSIPLLWHELKRQWPAR